MDNEFGNFRNLGFDDNQVAMLEDMFRAINEADQWALLRTADLSITSPELNSISVRMKYPAHSGVTFEWVLKKMSVIAKNEWLYFIYSSLRDNCENLYPPGKFQNLKYDENEVEMLEDAYSAVGRSEMWCFLQKENFKSFMFDSPPEISKIDALLQYSGHSGSSYGWVMRNMEGIAKGGWNNFVRIRFDRIIQDLTKSD
jgi:hypothetical protein